MRSSFIIFAATLTLLSFAISAGEVVGLATLKMMPSGVGRSHGAGFLSVDGKRTEKWPDEISVVPGKHKIGYVCVVTVDGPPLPFVKMNFEAGKVYEFVCTTEGMQTAAVRVE